MDMYYKVCMLAVELDHAYCDIVVDKWQKYRRYNNLPDDFTKIPLEDDEN